MIPGNIHWKIRRRHIESERAAIQGLPGHRCWLGPTFWILARAYIVIYLNVVNESVFKLSSHDESSGQLMTRTNTASPDHTSRISPLTSPSYHVQRLTRCLLSNLQGRLRHPGFFSLLPLPCSSRKLAAGGRFTFFYPCHSLIFRILLSISFRSAKHTSVNWIDQVVHGLSIFYLLEQKYDHDYRPDWTNALREMKGINFDSWRTGTIQPLSKTVQEYCKQREWDMKNKNFQASSIVWNQTEEECLECASQRRQIAWTSVFCDGTCNRLKTSNRKRVTTSRSCSWRPCRSVSPSYRLINPLIEWVFSTTSMFLCVKSTSPKDVAIFS